MKRVFGRVEAAFDLFYLASALIIGLILLFGDPGNSVRRLAGAMALILAGGDAFHSTTRRTSEFGYSAIVYILAAVRMVLCVLPQNKWHDRYPPVNWGIWRNIPFFILGAIVAGLFFLYRNTVKGLGLVWLAIILSYIFYIPVVFWANRYPKIGVLMLPKSCAYLWLLTMCLVGLLVFPPGGLPFEKVCSPKRCMWRKDAGMPRSLMTIVT